MRAKSYSFLLGSCLFLQQAISGQLLNVDFGAHLNPAFSQKTGAAAIGASGDVWNLYSHNDPSGGIHANGMLENLRWADGGQSDVDIRVSNVAGAWYTFSSDPMFQSYLYPGSRSGDITAVVTNIPPGIYDLYVYAHGQPPEENAVVT